MRTVGHRIVDGKEQVFRVRDGDRPFRTTAFATRYDTVYSFNLFTGRFVKVSVHGCGVWEG